MAIFSDLKVWQNAHRFVLEAYRITKKFPRDEQYVLMQQVRRAAISVAANIVEGSKRRSRKDKVHFYNMADTSLEETKYHLLLSRDLGYRDKNEFESLLTSAEEIGRMLTWTYSFIGVLKL